MKGLVVAILLGLSMTGCAQVSLTVYSTTEGLDYTTVKVSDGTKVIITKNKIEIKEK